jgi:oxygen-independent coproporphyrinogen-3 oxidase
MTTGNAMVSNDRAPWIWPRAAYIHIPFCASRCSYCDFAIAVDQDHLIELYLEALATELATLGAAQRVDTLYVGGGTPTYLSARQLDRLLDEIIRWLPPGPGHEFSVEANPSTLDAEKLARLAAHGVTRVSLGVQSLQPHLLRILERDHTPADVPRAAEAVKRHGLSLSLDLILGTPGQTLVEWDADLHAALALEPAHVSTYGLTYEKGTPLWKRRAQGEIRQLDEEAELALYAHAIDVLEAAGFEHYEISNFALPGRRCRHNEVYWANHAYFGFGMGAARYVRGRREVNTRHLGTYLRKALAGERTTFQSEDLGQEERARETMAVQLRRAQGIERAGFQLQTGISLDDLAGAALAWHVDQGLLTDDGRSVRLTRRGKYVADVVIEALL